MASPISQISTAMGMGGSADMPSPPPSPDIVAPKLPSANEFFGAPKAALPTAEQFFAPPEPIGLVPDIGMPDPGTLNESLKAYNSKTATAVLDSHYSNSPDGIALNALGQGFKSGWGAAPPWSDEVNSALKQAGFYNDYQTGRTSIIRSFNEAFLRPTITAALTGAQALLERYPSAVQEAIEGAAQAPVPSVIQAVAGVAAAGAEAFPGGEFTGFPVSVPMRASRAISEVARLHDSGVLGTEAQWQGFEPIEPEPALQQNESANAQVQRAPEGSQVVAPTSTEVAALPDIHSVARQIDPQTFSEYDALQVRQGTYRRWLDELSTVRQQNAEANAPNAEQIKDLQQRLQGANQRMTKIYQGRLDALMPDYKDYIADQTSRDTPDMAKVRGNLIDSEHQLWDLSPQVTKAYGQAREMMPPQETGAGETVPEGEATAVGPTAKVPSTETAAAVPQEASPAETVQPQQSDDALSTRAPVPDIAIDVSQKLTAAGRPQEEADAAAAIVKSHYAARAANLTGTTPEQLYAESGPDIIGQEKGGPRGEASGKTTWDQDGTATTTLFAKADASTFIHESGHKWLAEMMRDASDPRATAAVRSDSETVRKWLNADPTSDLTTRQQEKFARGFERYAMEGHAPSRALADVFAKFKAWLTQIYQTVNKLRAPINDDIRRVFDRMISTPETESVIAPERGRAATLADQHERLAEETQPAQAHAVAGQVRSEVENAAGTNVPEITNAITGRSAEGTGGISAENAGTPNSANGAVPVSGEITPSGGARAIPEGGNETAPQGFRTPEPLERLYERVPREPPRLAAFLARLGGLKDDGGEVSHVLGDTRTRPGLINNKTGMPLDEAAELAWERGYLGGAERPTPDELVQSIREDVAGRKQYSSHDEAAVAEHEAAVNRNSEIDRLSDKYGIDTTKMTRAQFWDVVADKLSAEELEQERLSLGEANQAEFDEAEKRAKEWFESRGEAWEPDRLYGDTGERSLEDLENEYRTRENSAQLGPRPSGDERAGPARPDQGDVQNVGGQGGSSAGIAGSGEPKAIEQPIAERPVVAPKAEIPDTASQPIDQTEDRYFDKIANIRLKNFNRPEDIFEAAKEAADRNNNFMADRRGVVSDNQVFALAAAMGREASEIAPHVVGRAYNAEELAFYGKLFETSATEVRNLGRAAAEADTEEGYLQYMEAEARHKMTLDAVMAHFTGGLSEAGRALRIIQQIKKMPGFVEATRLSDIMKEDLGTTLYQLKRRARQVAELDTPEQISDYINKIEEPSYGEMLEEAFKSSLISGTFTHIAYLIGNKVLELYKAYPLTLAEATVGKVQELIKGSPVQRVRFGEIGAQARLEFNPGADNLYGMFKGEMDGWKSAYKALKAGQTDALPHEILDTLTKDELTEYNRLREQGDLFGEADPHAAALAKMGIGEPDITTPFTRTKAIPDFYPNVPIVGTLPIPLGSVIRVGGERMVAPFHSYSRTIAYNNMIARLAFRSAATAGLDGDAFSLEVARLTKNPTEEMMMAARNAANEAALMGKGGTLTQKISALTNWETEWPLLGRIKPLNFIDPFVNISGSVIRIGTTEHGALSALQPLFNRTVRDSLLGKNGDLAQSTTIARIALGTSLGAAGMGLYFGGKLTNSGPSQPNESRVWGMLNGMPHSIRIGDWSIETGRLGPIGYSLALAADLAHAVNYFNENSPKPGEPEPGLADQIGTIATMLALSFAHNMVDESALRGPTDLFRAVDEHEQYGARYLDNFFASFMPLSVGLAQMAREIDPYARVAKGMLQTLTAHLPGLSETLEPRIDLFGNPVPNRSFWGAYAQHVNNDPVLQTFDRLKYFPGMPKDAITGVHLTQPEFTDYAIQRGQQAHRLWEHSVTQSGFSYMSEANQRKLLEHDLTTATEQAEAYMKSRYPHIPQDAWAAKRLQMVPSATVH